MNVLIFVMTMLMVFAMMTYAKMENFRSFSHMQIQFQQYMQQIERKYISDQSLATYNKTSMSQGKAGAKGPRAAASPRLSWYLLTNSADREKQPEAYDQMVSFSKKLIHLLYGDQAFFKEAVEKRPNLLDDLFAKLASDYKMVKASEFANIDLGDSVLNDTFYKMLKGNPVIERKTEQSEIIPEQVTPTDEEELAAAAEAEQEALESKADEGYTSLLDYITIDKTQKIRLFLAPPAFLLAIFGDESFVRDIQEERYRLYRQLVNGSIKPEDANGQFQAFVASRIGNFNPEQFDYTVSKVNPRDYEVVK